ncbi:hypothetical protein FKM82_012297 [Ascaphus truei]
MEYMQDGVSTCALYTSRKVSEETEKFFLIFRTDLRITGNDIPLKSPYFRAVSLAWLMHLLQFPADVRYTSRAKYVNSRAGTSSLYICAI